MQLSDVNQSKQLISLKTLSIDNVNAFHQEIVKTIVNFNRWFFYLRSSITALSGW